MNKKDVLLAFVLFSLCLAGLLRLQIAYASPYTDIDVATAYNMIMNGSYPDLVVLDVRTKSEYDIGHIYGAVWIPHTELETRIGELAGHENHEIIVYCGSGVRSAIASETLDSHSFTKVYNMLGGISAWQSAGYPVWIATVHNVNTTFNYDTIQAAIDAPQTLEGHSILVDTGTYYEHVVVNKTVSLIGENKQNTIIDGNDTGNVIHIIANNVNISGFTIQNGIYIDSFHGGILVSSSGNNMKGNIITDNYNGIFLNSSDDNTFSGNNVSLNYNSGIYLNKSNYNAFVDNTFFSMAEAGIFLNDSNNNTIFHNNFINNGWHVGIRESFNNTWDDGYPSGGNYWSDHNPLDLYSGPYQNETGRDKIGDIAYVIDGNNADRYPLIYPYGYVPSPDLNDDGKVTITDIVICALAFGSKPGDPNWNPIVDLNQDGKVTITDIVMIAIHFGETW